MTSQRKRIQQVAVQQVAVQQVAVQQVAVQQVAVEVTGGVDTHQDTHTAAALDAAGRLLGSAQFRADAAGYVALLAWLRTFGAVVLIGIEGTGV
ncbi:IS110 family transposase, partial [Kineococcus arenarius]|uniref:IS110 family transposase n=1 Tax=Kineococcus sp. SYSU DK007 TaxID=3383128 RepID=UPI003D7D8E24